MFRDNLSHPEPVQPVFSIDIPYMRSISFCYQKLEVLTVITRLRGSRLEERQKPSFIS